MTGSFVSGVVCTEGWPGVLGVDLEPTWRAHLARSAHVSGAAPVAGRRVDHAVLAGPAGPPRPAGAVRRERDGRPLCGRRRVLGAVDGDPGQGTRPVARRPAARG